jgi:CheY-like chemotaxis protein
VVDDDDGQRSAVVRARRAEGFVVLKAATGHEAL